MIASASTAATPETIDQLIARVLNRARGAMMELDSPAAARVVLDVAHSFADELAALDPRFDRLQFIRDATDHPSE